jgi:hypothetical protein
MTALIALTAFGWLWWVYERLPQRVQMWLRRL